MGEHLRVYSTPSMVLDIEDACKDFLQEHLSEEESSVGARVEIDHLGPTLIGMWVEIEVTITGIDGRKVSFDAEVRDSVEVVGRAKHTRVIVNLAKQEARLRSKAARAAQQPS
jgi:predicted thioesterase